MVTRKPVSGSTPSPPYPTYSPGQHMGPLSSHPPSPRIPDENEAQEQNPWNSERKHRGAAANELGNSQEDLPASLRAGGSPTPRSSSEIQRPAQPTNPYIRRQMTGNESSADAWNIVEKPVQTSQAQRPIPTTKVIPPTPEFSKLTMSEPSVNPWQPALDAAPLQSHSEAPELERQNSSNDVWASVPPPNRAPPTLPASDSPALISFDSDDESPAWDEDDDDDDEPVISELPATEIPRIDDSHEEENAWGAAEAQRKKQEAELEAGRLAQAEQMKQSEGWASGPSGTQPQESGIINASGGAVVTKVEKVIPQRFDPEDDGPALPPRPSQEEPPLQPPRPLTQTISRSESSLASAAKKQRKETYEIRKIRWHDATTTNNPRTSPILVQNVNGPCPLLALVNALVLSTSASLQTPLVEALRTREQISLLLLLDAVIDELMSGRRGDEDQELPDVIDLHYFLLDLHTGMNVNPRFMPTPVLNQKIDPRRSLTHVHPSEREDTLPGTFEETRETFLYNTFSIPLIHGWLPPKDSPAYAALKRSAPSYEEVQNLQFREEELEAKLSREGLSFEEQGILEDIFIIKAFLNASATQLTPHGIDLIQKSIQPGAFAILFRNNHFSTLYRHPDTLQLFSLVTDMGYATHDEVVWESLTDINGENSELFSGDFRLVGGAPSSPRQSVSSASGGWNTVAGRLGDQGSSSHASAAPRTPQSMDATLSRPGTSNYEPPQTSNTEQEDHDLALALQMQDEEDRIAAEAEGRRRRELELSQQYIEQQGAAIGPNSQAANRTHSIPVSSHSSAGRRNGSAMSASDALRPAIPPRRSGQQAQRPADPEAGSDLPPPSYEQAATQPAYNPPAGSPNHPSTSPLAGGAAHPSTNVIGGIGGPRRQSSAHAGHPPSFSTGQTGRPLIERIPTHRRQGSTPASASVQQSQSQRDKDCIMM